MPGSRPSLKYLLLSTTLLSIPLFAQTGRLQIAANQANGQFSVSIDGSSTPILQAGAAIEVNGTWLKASDYPRHTVSKSTSSGELGQADEWTLTYTGRSDAPDLEIHLRGYLDKPFGDAQVIVKNTTGHALHVQAIRIIDGGADALQLGGSRADERVLSDSFSEDRPYEQIHDFKDPVKGMHRGVGSQIVYDLANHRSWFIGTLTNS